VERGDATGSRGSKVRAKTPESVKRTPASLQFSAGVILERGSLDRAPEWRCGGGEEGQKKRPEPPLMSDAELLVEDMKRDTPSLGFRKRQDRQFPQAGTFMLRSSTQTSETGK